MVSHIHCDSNLYSITHSSNTFCTLVLGGAILYFMGVTHPQPVSLDVGVIIIRQINTQTMCSDSSSAIYKLRAVFPRGLHWNCTENN